VAVAGRAVGVAPHPDDEILGAGGLVRALTLAGTRVEIWAVTDGENRFGSLSAGPARELAKPCAAWASPAWRCAGWASRMARSAPRPRTWRASSPLRSARATSA
jgi:hypothetical protein